MTIITRPNFSIRILKIKIFCCLVGEHFQFPINMWKLNYILLTRCLELHSNPYDTESDLPNKLIAINEIVLHLFQLFHGKCVQHDKLLFVLIITDASC